MFKYAISIPDCVLLNSDWRAAIAASKIRHFEISCEKLCVEEGSNLKQEVALLRQMQAKQEIDVASVHIPFGKGLEISAPDETVRRASLDKILRFLEECAPLQCKEYTLHPCLEPVPLEAQERAEHIAASRQTLTDLLPVAKQMGIHINVEDLPRSCLARTAEELAAIVDGFPEEQIGVCFDVNHLCGAADKLAASIRQHAARIHSFHLSDYDGVDECHWYPGMGVIPWGEVINAMKQVPYDFIAIFECIRFLQAPQWQKRTVSPACILRSFERNVFFMENAEEILTRIQKQTYR